MRPEDKKQTKQKELADPTILLKIDENIKRLPVIIPSNVENLAHPNGLKSLSTAAAKTDLMVRHVP